jgi:hypothetical protein
MGERSSDILLKKENKILDARLVVVNFIGDSVSFKMLSKEALLEVR